MLEIVPLVGPLIAATLAGTVAYASRGTDTTIVVLVAYLVVRQIEDQVVMPLVIGRAVHLHPVVTIFAVLVGLSAWGVLGGLLAVPVAAALNVTLHELYPEQTRYHQELAGSRRIGARLRPERLRPSRFGPRLGPRLRPANAGEDQAAKKPEDPLGGGPAGGPADGPAVDAPAVDAPGS